MAHIKNIVFDLGGVVIDLRREAAVEALSALGVKGVDEMLGLYRQQPPFLLLETGHITAGEFYDVIRQKAGRALTDKEIQDAFNKFLIDIPLERLELLLQLRRKGYRLYVISNTNAVMYHSWIEKKFRQIEPLSVNDYFDGIVVSFEERVCKPDEAIFRILLRRYNLNPAETIMLDDSAANCESARNAGLQSCRIDNSSPDHSMKAVAERLLGEISSNTL